MKQILISIKPKWVAKILSGEKTFEIRKTAPKCELPCEVYIYCTKSNKEGWCMVGKGDNKSYFQAFDRRDDLYNVYRHYVANGNVVAKFTLKTFHPIIFIDKYTRENSCLTTSQIIEYMGDNNTIYAWHIKDLEIFDDPKDLSEFSVTKKYKSCDECPHYECDKRFEHCLTCEEQVPLKRAPQSWCYVEENK